MNDQVGRLSVPSGWDEGHAPIIGELLTEIAGHELLKKDTIYAIVEHSGVLTLVELGPSALEPQESGAHYGWQIQDMMTQSNGAYVMTEEEFARSGRSKRSDR